jgi:hypothetical protein
MMHQSFTVIISAGSCWLFLLLGWAAAVNNNTNDIWRPLMKAGQESGCVSMLLQTNI